jgi:broad specificity phosphatase PhoE
MVAEKQNMEGNMSVYGVNASETNSLNLDSSQANPTTEKVKSVGQQKFAIMRVAAHDKNGITEEGKKRAFSAMAEIEYLATIEGAGTIRIVHSDTQSAKETVEYMRRCQLSDKILTIDDGDIAVDARLDESKSGPLLKKLKKENSPAFKEYEKLSPEAKFEAKPISEYESGREMFNRMNSAIEAHLDAADKGDFTVFITHQNSMLNWMRGLGEQAPTDWRKHHSTTGEIYPMQRLNGVFSQNGDRVRPKIEGVIV